jgi:hypothetical protein
MMVFRLIQKLVAARRGSEYNISFPFYSRPSQLAAMTLGAHHDIMRAFYVT